jgi:hypothetical protein
MIGSGSARRRFGGYYPDESLCFTRLIYLHGSIGWRRRGWGLMAESSSRRNGRDRM